MRPDNTPEALVNEMCAQLRAVMKVWPGLKAKFADLAEALGCAEPAPQSQMSRYECDVPGACYFLNT